MAVSTARRTPVLPDVPTIAEAALPGYEFQAWFGVFAPAGTPRRVVEKISKEVARVVELPELKKQMHNQGEEPKSSTPEAFAKFIRAEIEKTRQTVKRANIRVE